MASSLLLPINAQGEWAAKRFYGDPKLAAAYLPIAYKLLGDVKNRMALGQGVNYGHQAILLPNGVRIRVIINNQHHILEVDASAITKPTAVLYQLISFWYYQKDSYKDEQRKYPNGYYIETADNGEKNVKPRPIPFTYEDDKYRCLTRQDYDRKEGHDKLTDGLYHGYGNQFVLDADRSVYSWLHSAGGDLPFPWFKSFPAFMSMRMRYVPVYVEPNQYEPGPSGYMYLDETLVPNYFGASVYFNGKTLFNVGSSIVAGVGFAENGDVLVCGASYSSLSLFWYRNGKVYGGSVFLTVTNIITHPVRFNNDATKLTGLAHDKAITRSGTFPTLYHFEYGITYDKKAKVYSLTRTRYDPYYLEYTGKEYSESVFEQKVFSVGNGYRIATATSTANYQKKFTCPIGVGYSTKGELKKALVSYTENIDANADGDYGSNSGSTTTSVGHGLYNTSLNAHGKHYTTTRYEKIVKLEIMGKLASVKVYSDYSYIRDDIRTAYIINTPKKVTAPNGAEVWIYDQEASDSYNATSNCSSTNNNNGDGMIPLYLNTVKDGFLFLKLNYNSTRTGTSSAKAPTVDKRTSTNIGWYNAYSCGAFFRDITSTGFTGGSYESAVDLITADCTMMVGSHEKTSPTVVVANKTYSPTPYSRYYHEFRSSGNCGVTQTIEKSDPPADIIAQIIQCDNQVGFFTPIGSNSVVDRNIDKLEGIPELFSLTFSQKGFLGTMSCVIDPAESEDDDVHRDVYSSNVSGWFRPYYAKNTYKDDELKYANFHLHYFDQIIPDKLLLKKVVEDLTVYPIGWGITKA